MNKLYSQYPTVVRGRRARLEHEMLFHVFGVPLVVASDSETIIHHVDAALGRWKSLPTSYREDIAPKRLEILIGEAMSAEVSGFGFQLDWHGRDTLISVSGRGLSATATETGGVVFAAPEWASLGREFADVVVTPLAVFLAAGALDQARVFLRASAFVHRDAALVLLGESDTARLQLAGDLHRAGLEMLASDFLLAARHPARGLELWGHPAAIPPPVQMPADEGCDPQSWTPLPREGGAKVHLQHMGPVLFAVQDDGAPGPEAEDFPAPLQSNPKAMLKRCAGLASLLYPPDSVAHDGTPDPSCRSILAQLAKSPGVRLPHGQPESMLPGLLRRLESLSG